MEKIKAINSLTLNFNLREPIGNKETNIYAVIKINKKQIKIATGLKIKSWLWDKNKQMPLIEKCVNLEEIENIIEIFNIIFKFRFAFMNYILYICQKGLNATENSVKEFMFNLKNFDEMNNQNLKKGEGRTPKATNLLKKAFGIYYNQMHTTIRESTKKESEKQLNAFKKYCEEINKDALSMLSQEGINNYQKFQINKREKEKENGAKRYASNVTINHRCEVIERLVNNVMVGDSAFLRYKIKPIKYNQLEEVHQKGDEKERRPLKDDEIEKLINCELNEEDSEYRDLFVLECFASVRISDMDKLFNKEKHEVIKKGEYELMTIKTKKKGVISVIWLNESVKKILEKYKGGLKFADLSDTNKYNYHLKKIAKKAGLNSIEKFKNAHNEEMQKPLFDIIGSHFARYTFIHNGLYKYGFTSNELKDFTGHGDERMINDCYRVESREDKTNNVAKALDRIKKNKEGESTKRIDNNNIKEQDYWIREAKEALFCLGADLNELVDINDLHKLNEILYIDYHNKLMEIGCDMNKIKELYVCDDKLTEKRKLIKEIIDKAKENINK